ncbi:transposase [Streptomyces phaeochromogenes]|uniref:Transposase n=1 Tax=Streptomyces phaeochromogenes TaxID=1923 RepID=A0ABZ1HV79_STRPH|nr:hypothetical protein [Streptomyces phaeochromogenes]WSD21139.1 transposase [Streptomyces phaeochromogenes]
MRDQDAWLCFADEAGQLLRPPKACTWSRRGCPPLVRVRAAGSGRISMAGLVCRKADAAHQQLGGNIVLVWDNYSHHVDAAMRELIGKRPWLTVFRFPRRLAVGQERFR